MPLIPLAFLGPVQLPPKELLWVAFAPIVEVGEYFVPAMYCFVPIALVSSVLDLVIYTTLSSLLASE